MTKPAPAELALRGLLPPKPGASPGSGLLGWLGALAILSVAIGWWRRG